MSLGNYFKFGVLAFVVAAGVDACTGDKVPADPVEAAKHKAAVANVEKIKQCVSVWDGSVYSVVKTVKEALRDPSSFEHVSTDFNFNFVESERELVYSMKYRARNGFGGVNVEAVAGTIDVDTCQVKAIRKYL